MSPWKTLLSCCEFEVQLQILMQRIKEFLANCYEGYESKAAAPTSQASLATRGSSQTRRIRRLSDKLSCGYSQKPDQQSEKDQRTENRKHRMQRVKLKERIARGPMPCRQHKTSLKDARATATDNL